ncbi:MAG: 3-dehydroquinate synthase, partial [Alphaproteobacteria bacterium]|nr:3-dehydroquinate synthase [Alphaproteobacteria bacterium]
MPERRPRFEVPVALGTRSYTILIGSGTLADANNLLSPLLKGRAPCIIYDANVTPHLAQLTAQLPAAKCFEITSGESSKSWLILEKLVDWLLEQGVERADHIIA